MTTNNTNLNYDGLDLTNMPSMADLLGDAIQKEFTINSIITGTIVEKRNDGVLLDIGYKAEGFISSEEFPKWDKVKLGDTIEVLLETLEDRKHRPSVSYQKAAFKKSWDKITSELGEGSVTTGLMKQRVKGGILVDVEGIEAFLPGSQIDIGPIKDIDQFIGKEYEFKILKINEDRKNIVVSRRELLEADQAEKRSELLKNMAIDQIHKGVVKNITDFGAFVDLGGVDGLLHITDMSWGRISHPSEMLEVGQELEVKIIDIDNNKNRVSLGIKQKTDNPWNNILEKYPIGSKIKGRVVNIMPYGAFIEIVDGVEGLVHVSEMSWTKRITKAGEVVSVGEEVDAVILDIQTEAKKISLGLRQITNNPWKVLADKYPVGSKITGAVRNMTSYGAFIEIEDDIDGMIHVSDMSWTRKINNPNEILKAGEEIETVVLEIDADQQRISLGLKQNESDPWSNIDELYKIGGLVKGKVSKITAFGAFIELSNKIDGLVHISQISNERVEKVKDVLSLGEEIEARVIKIDVEERRIGLSIKVAKQADFSEEALKQAEEEYTAALHPDEEIVAMGDILSSSFAELNESKKQAKSKKDAKDKAKNEAKVKEEAKDEAKEEVKEEAKDEAKEEVKDEAKEEVKDEAKEEVKDEAKEEVKDEVKEEK